MGLPKPATGHSPHTSDTAGSGDRRALHYPGRLLFISSHNNERGAYAEYLLDKGYCVLETQSPAEASRLTKNVWLSAVITDVRLSSGQDGMRLTIQLGRHARVARLPAMVVPGELAAGNLDAAERGGCDLVLLKPCPPGVLAEITGRLVDVRKQRSSFRRRRVTAPR